MLIREHLRSFYTLDVFLQCFFIVADQPLLTHVLFGMTKWSLEFKIANQEAKQLK